MVHHSKNELMVNKALTCTWNTEADCFNCILQKDLDCKWDLKHLIRFYMIGMPFFIPAALGLVLTGLWTGNWVGLIIYGIFWVIFFGLFEIRVLCRHCPYYAKEGKVLHCLANHGLLKVWKYEPGPMNRWEKIGLLLGFTLFLGIPIFLNIYKLLILFVTNSGLIQIMIFTILVLLTIAGTLITGRNLTIKVCTRCVNFSCPLNRVSKPIRDSYLMNNPVMRKAWENTGYSLDKPIKRS